MSALGVFKLMTALLSNRLCRSCQLLMVTSDWLDLASRYFLQPVVKRESKNSIQIGITRDFMMFLLMLKINPKS